MTEIYLEISKLSDKFRTMCYGITKDKEDIDNAVQELCLYFLSMNPSTLKAIWEKDGQEGIIRYGAVVLRRSLTSPRSPFYYKYKKYYTNLQYRTSTSTQSNLNDFYTSIYNVPEEEIEEYQWTKLEQIDKVLDKMNWYDRKLFQLYYYESNTLDSLAEKTKISRNSLFTTIDKVRTILKKELSDE
jgi:RNA polymerase sigma factor (sigma-70 family)